MQILYYDGGSRKKRTAVEAILKQYQFTYRLLDEDDVIQTLGYLMDLDGFKENDSSLIAHVSQDLLVMNTLEDEQIQMLSNALREHKCHVECKAMLTQHNKHWTFAYLLEEINKEHAYFKSYEQLKQCIIEASDMLKDRYTKESWDIYQQEFLQGYTYLQKQDVAKELLDEAVNKIQIAKEKLQLK